MKEQMQELAYLVRCFNAVGRALQYTHGSPRMTPAQVAQMRRWRAVRRALALDINQALQALPKGVQLVYGVSDEQDAAVGAWERDALDTFIGNGKATPRGMEWRVVQHHEQEG